MGFHNFISITEYRNLAESDKFKPPKCANIDDLDQIYWDQIENTCPLYGSEVDGSLFDDECQPRHQLKKVMTANPG